MLYSINRSLLKVAIAQKSPKEKELVLRKDTGKLFI